MATQSAMEKTAKNEVTRMEHTRSGRRYRPNVDILEQPHELTVIADVPGVRPEDIDVNFENGLLTLYGRVAERHPQQSAYLLAEYGVGDFYREFQVSETVNAEGIAAEYRDGVLTLHLPKVDAAKPRKIEVRSA